MISINNLPENYTIEAKEMNNLRGGLPIRAIICVAVFLKGVYDGYHEAS